MFLGVGLRVEDEWLGRVDENSVDCNSKLNLKGSL
jgi:hypothetical protein